MPGEYFKSSLCHADRMKGMKFLMIAPWACILLAFFTTTADTAAAGIDDGREEAREHWKKVGVYGDKYLQPTPAFGIGTVEQLREMKKCTFEDRCEGDARCFKNFDEDIGWCLEARGPQPQYCPTDPDCAYNGGACSRVNCECNYYPRRGNLCCDTFFPESCR